MKKFKQLSKRTRILAALGLVLLPVFLVLVYGLYANISRLIRFDPVYFSPAYQEKYDVPAAVATDLEEAIQEGDEVLYTELTGLQRSPQSLEPQPNVYLSILLDVDDADYYHYLYFNFETYRRSIYYLKEVKGRWIVAPTDLYFYWDSQQWWDFTLPPVLTYWSVLILLGVGYFVSQRAAAYRRERFGG